MTLRTLRIEKGISLIELAAIVSEKTGVPYSWRGAHMWEIRGTNKANIISALAEIYGRTHDEIVIASRASADGKGPALRAGRPRKIIANIAI